MGKSLKQQLKDKDKRIQELEAEIGELKTKQREFLSLLGHNLRIPINAIFGFSQFIKDAMFGQLNRKYVEYAYDIERASEEILQLISNVIVIFDPEAERMEEMEFTIASLFNELVSTHTQPITNKRLQFVTDIEDESLAIIADRDKMKQMLSAVLTNSIKYTQKGTIKLSSYKTDNSLVIECMDTGIGIEEEHLDRVFDPFYRAQYGTRVGYTGAGIGLTIVKTLIEQHGGTISVRSEYGKYTTIIMKLPKSRIV